MDERNEGHKPGRLMSRKEARRILRHVTIGIGAMLLAAVDEWNEQQAHHSAPFRTALHPLGHGAAIASMAAASTEVWLNTPGMHPPSHIAVKQESAWPAVSSRSKTFMAIHHNEARPTNPRKAAFCAQEPDKLDIPGDPLLCELTWEYDLMRTHIRRIWVSAPTVEWEPFEVPMAKVQAQYAKWRKDKMRWLPGTALTPISAAEPMPARTDDDLEPSIEIKPRPTEETGDA